MAHNIDLKYFCENLQATKPPYDCPIPGCGRVFRSYTGIHHHVLSHDTPSTSSPLSSASRGASRAHITPGVRRGKPVHSPIGRRGRGAHGGRGGRGAGGNHGFPTTTSPRLHSSMSRDMGLADSDIVEVIQWLMIWILIRLNCLRIVTLNFLFCICKLTWHVSFVFQL